MYPPSRRGPRCDRSSISAVTVRLYRARTALVGSIATVGLLAGALSGCGASDDSADATPNDEAPAAAAAPTATAAVTASADPGDDSAGGSDDDASQTAAATPATTAAGAAPAETRPEVLLLNTQQLDGQQFDLAAAAGNDVLVWFWAPW